MQISLKRIDDAFHMQATNETGNIVETDGSPAIGGKSQAMRPMQLMLVGLGSCSSIDIIHLLRKQREELRDIQIEVNGERVEGEVPSLFSKIHIHYDLYGKINEKKAERAVNLSMDKMCSVAKIIEKTAEITHSYTIHE